MKLVDNWRAGWRMASVQISVLIAVLSVLQAQLPSFQAFMPPKWFAAITALLAVLLVVVRLVYQPELHPEDVQR